MSRALGVFSTKERSGHKDQLMMRIVLSLLLIVLGAGQSSLAVPFDLIVPADVELRSPAGISGVGSPWGWVVATEKELSFDQLKGRVFTLSTDNPNVSVSTTFNPSTVWTPMQPGDIAGLDHVPFTSAFRELQQPDEVVNPLSSNFWRWNIRFPPEFVGEVNLHSILEIDGAFATFDTLLRLDPSFGTDTNVITIVAAQRVTAVSEPAPPLGPPFGEPPFGGPPIGDPPFGHPFDDPPFGPPFGAPPFGGPPFAPPGDGNLNGVVEAADYTIWAKGFGSASPQFIDGDYNGDDAIDAADYTIWANNFGMMIRNDGPIPVPEPSTLTLGVLGLMGLVACGWRRKHV